MHPQHRIPLNKLILKVRIGPKVLIQNGKLSKTSGNTRRSTGTNRKNSPNLKRLWTNTPKKRVVSNNQKTLPLQHMTYLKQRMCGSLLRWYNTTTKSSMVIQMASGVENLMKIKEVAMVDMAEAVVVINS
jgi:hypothetical protein